MADEAQDKVEALQLADTDEKNVQVIENYEKLAEVELPESDQDKINLIRKTWKAVDRTNILISWFNGRVAYAYANQDEGEESDGNTVDESLDHLQEELGFAKSTLYNYYALYQRCSLEKLNKFSEAGVSWSVIRQYVLNRNQDTGDKMMDYIDSQIDENNGYAPKKFEKDYLKPKLAELTGNSGQSSSQSSSKDNSQQGAEASQPAVEDQMLETLQALKDKMEKSAEGLEGYASDFFDGSGFREYIEQLFTVEFDDAQEKKRDQILTQLIEQFTRTMKILADLQIDSAMYSKTNKEKVASGASELVNLFARDGLTPVVYEDETVGVDLDDEEEGNEETESSENNQSSE